MKLLEYELQNMQILVTRDLNIVFEDNEVEYKGVDPKQLSEQVKVGINKSMHKL